MTRARWWRIVASLAVISIAGPNRATVQAEQAPTQLTPDERVYGLSRIWSEARCNFANFDLTPDLDWDQAFREYLPKAIQEQSNAEYYRLLRRFVALLRDGHSDLSLPAYIRNTMDAPPIAVENIDGKPVILDFARGDELERSGIAAGAEITKIDGRPVAEVLQQDLFPFIAASTPQGRDAEAYGQLLRGPRGSRAVVEIRDLEGRTRTATLTRESSSSEAHRSYWTRMRRPAVEMRRFPGGIAYFALNSFGVEQAVEDFDRIFDGLADIRGIILDVRHNGGGNSGYGDAITGRLIDRPLAQFTAQIRQRLAGQEEMWCRFDGGTVPPRGKTPFLGAVVVLTSRHTASAAEDFVVVLHGNRRAVIVGGRTLGSTGQAVWFDLPGGGSARICAKKCLYPDGRPFVGVGIIPDVEVYPSQKDVAAGRDAVLEKGLEILREKLAGTPEAEIAFKTMHPAVAEGDYYLRRGQLPEAIRSCEEALKLEPHAVAVHLKMADLYRQQGDEQKASEHYQATGFVDNGAWMIIGPFDNADGAALDKPYMPEREVDFAKECAGKTGAVRWLKPANSRMDGFVDLVPVLKPSEWTVAYAATQMYSPEARNVQFRIGSDDEVKVWLNGNVVLDSNVPRFAAIDQDVLHVYLQSGWNDVLVKICNRTGFWGFYLRVTDPQGRPRDDLRFSPRGREGDSSPPHGIEK